MKSIIQITALVVVLIMCTAFNRASAAELLTVTIAYPNTSNYPFETGDNEDIDWEKPGVNLEVLKLIEAELGIKIIFKRLPWKRGLQELKSGRIDGLFGASFKQERLEYGVYPMKGETADAGRMFYELSYVFYTLRNADFHWDGKSFKAPANKGIGAISGYSVVEDLERMGAKVYTSHSDMNNMKKLELGHLIAVAAYSSSGDAIVSKHKDRFDDVIKLDPPIKEKPYYLMFSHQFYNAHNDIAESIWDVIASSRDSKEIKKIYEKYSN